MTEMQTCKVLPIRLQNDNFGFVKLRSKTKEPFEKEWQNKLALEKQILEGEALLEKFEDAQQKPGQLTVGFGWYQWGGHDSDEESQS